ncbi:hypothetical protein DOK67_0002859 [Enterococcus sp. DIV0212c]|uniref:DUF4041 domain-containing protein n=1 Tax=Enterococcus sp. DIV0212c TaxID=2230867 RepID=UPI001A9BF3A9|nr:DUF4041 domain-containing protein [Enterococcus sp. DIV0212c]MBO1354414.1 DUF4041 domain-containing protein [Enterococcus sp. DIV0212c]
MGILDIFKGKEYKQKFDQLEKEYELLRNEKLSIEQMDAVTLKKDIIKKEKEVENFSKIINSLKDKESLLLRDIQSKEQKLHELKRNLISVEDDIDMESFGLYVPRYDFASSLVYKEALGTLRNQQKQMVKDKTSVNYFDGWTVEGSKSKGRKMTNDNIKQILRSFNNECEAAINKVKFSNIEAIKKRITNSFNQLNKLNESNKLSLTPQYLNLKLQELSMAYEYERKKQDEKEELREQREREREEKALQKEITNQKKIIEKEIKHFRNMIDELKKKLEDASEDEKLSLNNQLLELEIKVQEKKEDEAELDYRTAHASAGYVYIISNIGSFGEQVVKIGVTRRLDPLDRIAELSSASVPFKFDVHALIFSYDAYKLENDLHRYFDKNRINRVNNRKEFFMISMPELKEVLQRYKDLTIDFIETPDAEEYRESLKISES